MSDLMFGLTFLLLIASAVVYLIPRSNPKPWLPLVKDLLKQPGWNKKVDNLIHPVGVRLIYGPTFILLYINDIHHDLSMWEQRQLRRLINKYRQTPPTVADETASDLAKSIVAYYEKEKK